MKTGNSLTSGLDFVLPLKATWVQFLVKVLRYPKLCNMAKKRKKLKAKLIQNKMKEGKPSMGIS